jgi:hypothetical protein
LSCSSTTRHRRPGEGGESLDLVRVGADGRAHWTHAWPTPKENPRHARLELWMAVYGYRIISRPASAFDWCEDEGGSRAQGGVDQRGKQDRHLIRSGLVVIAGGLADNIEQPPSLGAVLAWTSHHDLRLPGYSLLKHHMPELPAMHYATAITAAAMTIAVMAVSRSASRPGHARMRLLLRDPNSRNGAGRRAHGGSDG